MSKKLAILRVAKGLGLFHVARLLTRRAARVLCYHGIWLGDDGYRGDGMFMHPETFRARLALLRRLGYRVVTLPEAVEAACGRGNIGPCPVAITIDDGWFGTYRDMLPALLDEGMPATLYCDTRNLLEGKPIAHVMAATLRRAIGARPLSAEAQGPYAMATDGRRSIDERLQHARAFCAHAGIDPEPYLAARTFEYMTPQELQRFAASPGMRVELHTHRHTMGDHSVAAIRQEVTDNRAALADLLSTSPEAFRHFCYPSGDHRESDGEALSSLRVESATTTSQGLAVPAPDRRYAIPRILDGEQVSELEFEAELSGFLYLARQLAGARC